MKTIESLRSRTLTSSSPFIFRLSRSAWTSCDLPTSLERQESKIMRIRGSAAFVAVVITLALTSIIRPLEVSGQEETTLLETILSGQNDINIRDKDGQTALINAIKMYASQPGPRLVDVIKVLIEKGADVNIKDRMNMTALMWAIEMSPPGYNPTETVKLLLEHGAEVNARNYLNQTALNLAANRGSQTGGHSDIVKLLLEHGADILARDVNGGDTALMGAAWGAKSESVRLLLKYGADVNGTNKKGETALMNAASWAASYGDTETVRLLLENGANVNTLSLGSRNSALMEAVLAGNAGMARRLKNGTDVETAIKESSRCSAETASLLLKDGADVNAPNYLGKTVLMEAAEMGCIDLVRLFLEHDADVNRCDKNGKTALDYAAGFPKIVELLQARSGKKTLYLGSGSLKDGGTGRR